MGFPAIRRRTHVIIPALLLLTAAPFLSAPARASGYGDVQIRLNGGDNVAYIGETNIIEIWIENDEPLLGISMGFEMSISGVSYQFEPEYGLFGYTNPEGNAVGAFDLVHTETAYIDNASPDSIAVGGAAMMVPLPIQYGHTLCYTMALTIPPDQAEVPNGLCIDNIFIPPAMSWAFAESGFSYPPTYNYMENADPNNPTAPPICFDIVSTENEPPIITNCPEAPLVCNAGETVEYAFEAYDPDPGQEIAFAVISGPGSIDDFGLYTWTTQPEDTGEWIITVEAFDGQDATGCDFMIQVKEYNVPPEFVSDCGVSFTCKVGETFTHMFSAVDPDGWPSPLTYELVEGPGIIESPTGQYEFNPTIDDVGTWEVRVLANDGDSTALCVIYIHVYELYMQGDATGDGTISVADAVYVINYVFKGGPAPPTDEAGDANCDYTINVADAVCIINYVFKGGPEPSCRKPGACCLPDGSCIEVSEDSCTITEGTFYGDQVPCDETECPDPEPECCAITLSECPPAWLPEGRQYGTPVGTAGNSVTFTATVTKDPPRVIIFFLEDVSSEPGVCINYGDESGDEFDLKFIQTADVNPAALFNPPSADGMTIQTKNAVTSVSVTVTCYDWGAWGKIRACCVGTGGCEAYSPWRQIPIDVMPAGGNHIADAWMPHRANQAATWDEDWFPTNMERDGDGYTFYEEYRGTMNGTSAAYTNHDRHYPDHKELFLYDQDWLHLHGHSSHKYTLVTAIIVHYLNGDPAALMNGPGFKAGNHRHVTWKSEFSHTDNQYALHILSVNLNGPRSWGLAAGDPNDAAPIGPPNTAVEIRVDDAQVATDLSVSITNQGGNPATTESAAYNDRRRRITTRVTSHEMGHGTDVVHHTAAGGGRASPYGGQYCGEVMCMMRYIFDLIDISDATHPNMGGIRTAALSPPGTLPARFEFSNYTDKDLSDLTPVPNTFCTQNDNCRGQIDVKDP